SFSRDWSSDVCSSDLQAKPTAHSNWFDDCAAAVVRIADPAGYLLDPGIVQVKPISEQAKKRAPYLRTSSPAISEILDAQRAARGDRKSVVEGESVRDG